MTLPDEALLHLKYYLEDLLKGLSKDIAKQRNDSSTDYSYLSLSLYRILSLLVENKQRIMMNMQLIYGNPITDLRGEYSVKSHSKKMNAKSFLWLAQNNGMRSSNNNTSQLYLEKHARITYINIENQWLKFFIVFLMSRLNKLKVSLIKELNNTGKRIFDQQNLIREIQIKQKGSNSFGYTNTIRNLINREKSSQNKILELENNCGLLISDIKLIRQITYSLSVLNEENWFKEISSIKPKKVTQRLLKDSRYRRFYRIFQEISEIETPSIKAVNPDFQLRRTWELFEYYNTGLVIDVLLGNNYKWVSGWLADNENPHQYIGTMPSDILMRFEKEDSDHFIEMAYDKELEANVSNRSYSRYFNDRGRRPDILITIYNSDGSLYSDKAGLIIESKCRNHRYLINNEIAPDVKEQLVDFKKLEYFDSTSIETGGDTVKTPIQQVIVLYPRPRRQNEQKAFLKDHIYGDGIVYIQIEPSNPQDNCKPFGYDILKQKIDGFLSMIKEGEDSYAE